MNVLFLMIAPVKIIESPNLYTELMEEFKGNGHNVYVAVINERRNGRKTRIDNENGIDILRIRTGNIFNVNPIEKGLTTISLGNAFKRAINFFYNHIKFDIVIMPTPPITFDSVIKYIKRRDGAVAYLILRDIFPQNARDIGLMKSKALFLFFRYKEKKMYQVSDYIGCMSQGNIDYVLKHNPDVNKDKFEILHNWCRVNSKRSTWKDYKVKYGLDGKFICVFGGNIGWPQELEFLLELAEAVNTRDDIRFLIVGKGIKKQKIQTLAQAKNLTNVIFMDFLSKEDYDGLISQCDVGLINLDRRFTIPNIPSKTTGYFDVGLPILASIDESTDYGEILDEAKAGLWSITGDIEKYKSNLLYMVDHLQETKQMGENGRKYLEKKLTVEKAYQTIIKHFE